MADPNEVLPGPGRESSGDRPQTASDPQATRISSVRAVIPLGPVSEEKVRKSTIQAKVFNVSGRDHRLRRGGIRGGIRRRLDRCGDRWEFFAPAYGR